MSAPAAAQVVRDFSPRFVANDRGDVRMFGNTVTSCTSNLSPTCASVQDGTALTELNNNDHFISFVDVDADSATFNSSAASVSLPQGATLLFAGLYWGGETGGFGTSGQLAPDASKKNQVQLLTPASGAYQNVLANTCDETNLGSEFGLYYQCFANVTSLVTQGGVGAYTVANIQTSNGFNSHGGWGLILVYRDPAEPVRNLVVYDGFVAVTVYRTGSPTT